MMLHEKLRKLCAARRWGQADLLAASGARVTKTSMSNYFKGKHVPDLATALRFARALGTTLEYLADDTIGGEPPTPQLDNDELAAVELYRQIRAAIGPKALLALSRIAQGYGTEEGFAEATRGPATFLGRADLSESDANRQREQNRPKKVGGGKPKAKAKGGDSR